MAKRFNPIAFKPWPVTIIVTLVYAALIASLLVVHLVVPRAPSDTSSHGVNLTEAFLDLQILSNGFHPYNSKRNDVVREWLLERIKAILSENRVLYSYSTSEAVAGSERSGSEAIIFDDLRSNLTASIESFGSPAITTYFEGTNIIVYIRGSNDPDGDFWNNKKFQGPGGVLVNAHYDSVPAGYGATDDGVGVVSILQLIRHYTMPENQPKKGLVLLLNNGEEDFLNGARAFAMSPISRFPRVFLNLEGAGAGGRAALFRTTDTEITHSYRGTESPLGTVILDDLFKQGFVRSQTDYVVFNGNLGMRGLDVAFFEPRARYHTDQDDARHTSIDSIWHMLSAALHTTKQLTYDTETIYQEGKGSRGVWFDILGNSFIVFQLHSLFAISVTLLVAAPIAIIIAAAFVSKTGRLYLFSFTEGIHETDGKETVSLGGFRGFFRYPFIFFVPTAITVAVAFLMVKLNPFVTYSSPYAAWSMMLSAWLFSAWFLSRFGDFVRPSALHRTYSLLWMFVIFWALLVVITVFEDQLNIASGYLIVWTFFSVALATFISITEQFRLEKKEIFASGHYEEISSHIRRRTASTSSRGQIINTSSSRQSAQGVGTDDDGEDDEPTEATSLLNPPKTTTFANYSSSGNESAIDAESSIENLPSVYDYEQSWSRHLPSWLWIVQFLLLAPITVLLAGQIGLQLITAAYQTSSDGNSPLTVLLIMAAFTALLLAPTTPFLHRFTYHIPTFLLLVSIGTLIYNLVAFPFSPANRLKVFFVQRVDLGSGTNEIGLSGIGTPYLDEIVHSLPSTAGQRIRTRPSSRTDLTEYLWEGIAPDLKLDKWMNFSAIRLNSSAKDTEAVRFKIRGLNTRGCKLLFHNPVADFEVHGSATHPAFPKMPTSGFGSKEIRLWNRKWGDGWTVDASWALNDRRRHDDGGQKGKVICLWNDDGTGKILALEELRRFAPDWAVVVNSGNGLVEGWRDFEI